MTKTDQDRADFEAWFEDTAGFTVEDTAIAWSSWQRALAHERARAQGEQVAVPDDGSCVRCGSVPRNASGLCATCLDEDAVRAGEVEDEASQALWRQTLDQERVPAAPPAESREVERKGGLEEVGATDLGYTIYREQNGVGGHRYWSDEIGGGVVAWDTCLVAPETLQTCLRIEMGEELHSDIAAPPPEPAKAEVVDAALWCAHVRGPDDVAAAASYDDAVALCDQINAIAKAYAHLDVMVVAYPALWPWDAQSHAANLAKGNGYRGPTLATTPTAPAAARSAAEAKMHAVNLEQCSIFVESEPIKRAMTDAAAFIRASLPGEEA